MILFKRPLYRDTWPINEEARKPPDGWPGWPDQKRFALVLTHDVDTAKGHEKCCQLMDIENTLGFRSSFNFVPERYENSPRLRQDLVERGFEVVVHGLNHDGRLFSSKRIFQERAIQINHYLKAWGAKGFTSPAMHHKLDWMHNLEIGHATSTFDTDPFEPQPDGVKTIFPFWVGLSATQRGYLELPYTLPQDFTLFVLMREKDISIWKQKLDWIVKNQGMALLNTHPDYMSFDGKKPRIDEYPATYYEEFLEYILNKYHGQYWHTLPKDLARFWHNSNLT